MSHTSKTTEFSTHLSRSRMRHYLHEQLGAAETQQVEVHLAHCAQCSATMVNYIETEEADQYNTYAKRLKGKLKEQKIAKRQWLSPFQIRALRATAAVVTLLIFSFFAVKTIINKELADYQPDGKEAQVKKKPTLISQKNPLRNKNTGKPTEEKSDKRLVENRSAQPEKSSLPTEKEVAPNKKPAQKTSIAPAPTTPKAVEKQEVSSENQLAEKKEESKATNGTSSEPAEEKKITVAEEKSEPIKKVPTLEQPSESEITEESSAQEAPAPVNTLPAVKKVDMNKSVDNSKPLNSTPLPAVTIPTNKLR